MATTSEALIQLAPFDGFAYPNARAFDMCVRTLDADQSILISPPQPDNVNATLMVRNDGVAVSGGLSAEGTMASPDVSTAALRLRRGPAVTDEIASPVTSLGRMIVEEVLTPVLRPAADVSIVLPTTILPADRTLYLGSSPAVNGRRRTVVNRSNADVMLVILRPDGTTTAIMTIAAGAEVNVYGWQDGWV